MFLNTCIPLCGTGWFYEASAFFSGISCSFIFLSLTIFLLSMGWHCWAGVFGLIGRQ